MARQRFFIIDAFAHIFRSYYAIRNIDNNAVFGFTAMLRKLLSSEKPEYIAVAFDTPTPSFRKELYPEYKANRSEMPEDLRPQIPLIKEMVRAFNLPLIEIDGFEADDVIGTLATQAAALGVQVVIVSGDKDMFQLVKDEDILILDPKRGMEFMGASALPEVFGVRPEQVIDLLTIWGDSSDNVPGVPGVGEKGAKNLLAEYGSLDKIYENLDKISRKAYREGFEKARDRLELTRTLVTIRRDLPVQFEQEAFSFKAANREQLQELLARLNFKTMLEEEKSAVQKVELGQCKKNYELLDSEARLIDWVARIREKGFFVFDTETTSLAPHQARLVGMSLALEPGVAAYVPLRHQGQDAGWALLAESYLKPLLSDANLRKCAHNVKYDYSVLSVQAWELNGVFDDTMLMSYLINPADTRHGLDELAENLLHYKTIHFEEVAGTGSAQITFDQVAIQEACQYAAEDADVCYQLYEVFSPQLEGLSLRRAYEEVERPLVPALARMELAGIRIDVAHLKMMSHKMEKQLVELERKIYDLAGESFNIKSTKQLGAILYEKLQLTPTKKTAKTKSYSTDQEVLEQLAEQGHPMPKALLEYRILSKLKSTYIDALPEMVDAVTGRVHSSFNQFVTSTGRLSSTNPNLQNIPVRTELGREIRAAFIPRENWVMIAADYSQIELRLLAHFSEDEVLVDAFQRGEDIHRRTAGEVMGVSPEFVTDEMRSAAKSINFGLIYGMGEFRLAQELGISRKKAKEYIETYFKKMPKVLAFKERIVEEATQAGEVRTYHGHRRLLPELHSKNAGIRAQGERLAVNTLIQGSAAEIIKVAMIRFDAALRAAQLSANLILQVHDELVVECAAPVVDQVMEMLKSSMEKVVNFRVPLTVEVHCGTNWKEVK